ncbi:hypothetical protein ZIOFF_036963 [Zingiber officinale]|uniref:Uncharacterized protein n=1 Tax=Zingiber officinale TaxID=94328 RepID=A0A8J5GNW2_ZINOF|nr:hypothetical protein ZIOFF_036963 [Zingiber officinale]
MSNIKIRSSDFKSLISIRMAPKQLDYELLNVNVKKVAYAVKGELYLRASELQKEGKKVMILSHTQFLLIVPQHDLS